ncbi:putative calcineurin-like phosphoesterase [Bacillus phage vB_BmeM-Goe8]|uniref:Putative calcineurin-like phosphoesterase n=1 Tax=Bacillus phage vB_BmeM-Goe8 TaxID=2593638 RepID=A0A516KMR2_9CAUD|nr:putative calcineurin-like phosphoesterase [Bacillus phage vB_BmeM-Goe8]QDP42883.1 putative calcineurin-like phosphoesterase [Bacillus phage vB_BmeM-Goe8]
MISVEESRRQALEQLKQRIPETPALVKKAEKFVNELAEIIYDVTGNRLEKVKVTKEEFAAIEEYTRKLRYARGIDHDALMESLEEKYGMVYEIVTAHGCVRIEAEGN